MPFTPVHMGPGLLIKALLQSSFSLMVFGWTQILMDIQPLVVMIKGSGHMHGFSHTYVGACLVALVAAPSGKYLGQLGLWLLKVTPSVYTPIRWPVAFISAFIGSFSHVFLDSLMHTDLQPFFPWILENPQLRLISVELLHKLCLATGLLGAIVLFGVQLWRNQK